MKIQIPHFGASQQTLKRAISLVGTGLHTGAKITMTLRPAEPNRGITFHRKDLRTRSNVVQARWYNVVNTELCTVVGNVQGVTVSTVEHLMAALYASGVDNVLVDLDGPEVPIMDGSAYPFVSLIEQIGTVVQAAPRFGLVVRKPVRVGDGANFAMMVPSHRFQVRVMVDFPGVGCQFVNFELVDGAFANTIAPARTFGFADQIEAIRQRGLGRGGHLRNTVVLDGARVLNDDGLRFPDELVRHKILDVIGDLALVGAPIVGRFIGYKPGHRLNQMLLNRLFGQRGAWCYRPLQDAPTPDRQGSSVDSNLRITG